MNRLTLSAIRGAILSILILPIVLLTPAEGAKEEKLFWIKARAKDKFERTKIVETGATIEAIKEDYVIVLGTDEHVRVLKKMGVIETSFVVDKLDFPAKDSNFHNYEELKQELQSLVARFPKIAALDSIGQSYEGREIFRMRISGDLANANTRAGVVFMGGHHAREHISIEMPLMLAKHLLEKYEAGDEEIVRLVNTRDIHIIPVVNPDGAEHDVAEGKYKFWRKNRRPNADGTIGVDLNRNYSHMWGTGGSSKSPYSDTYMGPEPFSEPETKAIKDFIDRQNNITTLLTLHTFSELILYPWAHTYDSIPKTQDLAVFEKMAQTMAQWNKYTPQQTSDLYIASGDTTDWAYNAHNIFAFTFELDPADMWSGGGFYPGQDMIPVVFQKNIKPFIYLIEHADNPYRVTQPAASAYGLSSPLVD